MKKSKGQKNKRLQEQRKVMCKGKTSHSKKLRKPSRKEHHKRKLVRAKRLPFRFFSEMTLLLLVLCVFLLFLMGTSSFFYSIKQVNGYGMMPSLRNKDVLVVKRQSELKRFDTVIINKGLEGEFRRIIGLPGEQISYKDDRLFVDGQPVDEKFIVDKVNENQAKGKQFTEDMCLVSMGQANEIPKECYLVLGDNRPYTTDSRDYGLVRKQAIGGKVTARIWPLEAAERF